MDNNRGLIDYHVRNDIYTITTDDVKAIVIDFVDLNSVKT